MADLDIETAINEPLDQRRPGLVDALVKIHAWCKPVLWHHPKVLP
jgi:hypothetical protein